MEKVMDKTERDFLVALEMHDFRRRLMQYLVGGIEIRRYGKVRPSAEEDPVSKRSLYFDLPLPFLLSPSMTVGAKEISDRRVFVCSGSLAVMFDRYFLSSRGLRETEPGKDLGAVLSRYRLKLHEKHKILYCFCDDDRKSFRSSLEGMFDALLETQEIYLREMLKM